MTLPEQSRSPVERMMDDIEWRLLPDACSSSDLHATHEGVLEIGELRLRCYTLSDGTRVFDADDVERFFGSRP